MVIYIYIYIYLHTLYTCIIIMYMLNIQITVNTIHTYLPWLYLQEAVVATRPHYCSMPPVHTRKRGAGSGPESWDGDRSGSESWYTGGWSQSWLEIWQAHDCTLALLTRLWGGGSWFLGTGNLEDMIWWDSGNLIPQNRVFMACIVQPRLVDGWLWLWKGWLKSRI